MSFHQIKSNVYKQSQYNIDGSTQTNKILTELSNTKQELMTTKDELKILKGLFNGLKYDVTLIKNEIKSNNIDNDSRNYNDKPMIKWNANDIKSWIQSLDTLKSKEKKIICHSIDDTGCYGKTLTCAPNASYLKDRFNISLKIAKKLLKQIKLFNDDSDASDSSDDSDPDDDSDDYSDDSAYLAKLIERNRQKKKDKNLDNNNYNSTNKPKLFSWGNNNLDNNNYTDTPDKFVVNIQGANGKYIQIGTKCSKDTKIRQVKQYLAAQEGGDPTKMRLKFNGRNMDDNQNLGFYGITESRNLCTVSYKVTGV
mmetsp:Transcript_102978/g.125873  ORF Transcript_102978/g.125873 Transcript_102978/m.125873 type:complete len:310 (-) Transcript_102978:199-1128(-)